MSASAFPHQTVERPVSIMFAVTASWLAPLAVTIYSICLHAHSRRSYEIQIVHDGLTPGEIKELRKAASGHAHVSLNFSMLPEKLFQSSRTGTAAAFPRCPTSACWLPAFSPNMTVSCTWMLMSC